MCARSLPRRWSRARRVNRRISMIDRKVVPHEEWVAARKELLKKEKDFSRMRDELTRLRQGLPWEKVEKEYVFDEPGGKGSLSDLFEGRSQRIIYHFMFDPQWDEGWLRPSNTTLKDPFPAGT